MSSRWRYLLIYSYIVYTVQYTVCICVCGVNIYNEITCPRPGPVRGGVGPRRGGPVTAVAWALEYPFLHCQIPNQIGKLPDPSVCLLCHAVVFCRLCGLLWSLQAASSSTHLSRDFLRGLRLVIFLWPTIMTSSMEGWVSSFFFSFPIWSDFNHWINFISVWNQDLEALPTRLPVSIISTYVKWLADLILTYLILT